MAQPRQPETTPYGNYYGHNAWPDEASTTDTSLSSTIQKQFWSSDDDDDDDDDLLHIVAKKAKARSAPSPICIPESSFATADSHRTNQPAPIVIVAVGRTGEGKSSLLNDIAGNMAFDAKMAVKSQTNDTRQFSGFWAPLRPYKRERNHFGCHVRIVDTPGFKDSEGRDAELLNKTRRAIMNLACDTGSDRGVNVILVVFKIYATSDLVMTTLQTLQILMHPITDFWPSVVLIFTHADYGNYESYRENKFCLHEEVTPRIREEFQLQEDLPMLFLSTKQHVCQYTRGAGECDCKRANKYHADCRRRLYEQIWNRRLVKISLDSGIIDATIKSDAHELISTMKDKSNDEKLSKMASDVEPEYGDGILATSKSTTSNDILVQPCSTDASTGFYFSSSLSSKESPGGFDSIGLPRTFYHSESKLLSTSSIHVSSMLSTTSIGGTSQNAKITMDDLWAQWDTDEQDARDLEQRIAWMKSEMSDDGAGDCEEERFGADDDITTSRYLVDVPTSHNPELQLQAPITKMLTPSTFAADFANPLSQSLAIPLVVEYSSAPATYSLETILSSSPEDLVTNIDRGDASKSSSNVPNICSTTPAIDSIPNSVPSTFTLSIASPGPTWSQPSSESDNLLEILGPTKKNTANTKQPCLDISSKFTFQSQTDPEIGNSCRQPAGGVAVSTTTPGFLESSYLKQTNGQIEISMVGDSGTQSLRAMNCSSSPPKGQLFNASSPVSSTEKKDDVFGKLGTKGFRIFAGLKRSYSKPELSIMTTTTSQADTR